MCIGMSFCAGLHRHTASGQMLAKKAQGCLEVPLDFGALLFYAYALEARYAFRKAFGVMDSKSALTPQNRLGENSQDSHGAYGRRFVLEECADSLNLFLGSGFPSFFYVQVRVIWERDSCLCWVLFLLDLERFRLLHENA